ncbi:MAG: hypothetical protein JSS69_18675 [Acidobacteria bacterium]|nr:hypothetical protein [Acidobacteriota bacterium]MBS1867940.1 hypothetical protein [Acidobacteriota bacterium]
MFATLKLAALCLFAIPLAGQSPSSEAQQSSPSQSTAAPSQDSSQSQHSPSWHNPKKYNPIKLVKRDGKSANDQLAENEELEQRLTGQLQAHGVLEKDANLQDKCSSFKSLQTCIAIIRASKSLNLEFLCLKWDVTGVKPERVSDACAGPSNGKAMSFRDSISLLKPEASAKDEAEKALKSAHDDIKDASS